MWLRVIVVVVTTLKLFGAQNTTEEDQDVSDQAYGFRRISKSVNVRRLYDPDTSEMMDDMIMPKELKKQLFEKNADNRRNAVKHEMLLWKDKTVRYFIDKEFSKAHKKEIMKGIKMIKKKSCVKFVELKKPPKKISQEKPYVHINSISGCYATIGSYCAKCQMSLGIDGCIYPGTVAHEFLHVLGFYHMQSSAGRDNYIEIIRENIKPDSYEGNFNEYADETTLLGTEYDYDSIMHYGGKFFSINGGYTIKTKDPKYQDKIGLQKDLSAGDITRLNKLYKCKEKKKG